MRYCILTVFSFVLYLAIMNGLMEGKNASFGDDMHSWIFLAVPTALVYSILTSLSVSSRAKRERVDVGGSCVIATLLLACLYVAELVVDSRAFGLAKGAEETLPALLWSAVLLGRGLWLLIKMSDDSEQDSTKS